MVASDWRRLERNTLLGFVSLALPSGLILREVGYHQKGDRRWVALPARAQIDTDGRQRIDPQTGKTLFVPVVEISRDRREAFQRAALAAIDRLLREGAR
jgi:hypothetical protein